MSDAPRRSKPRPLLHRDLPPLLAGLVLAVILGCSTDPDPCVSRVSAAAIDYYGKAEAQYRLARELDEHGPQLRDRMNEVVRLLRAAIHNSPKCPLFHAKLGDAYLTMRDARGQVSAPDEAKIAFEASLQPCDDPDGKLCRETWVPGWLGLAAWARELGKYDEAHTYLDSAVEAINNLRAKYDEEMGEHGSATSSLFGFLGIDNQPEDSDAPITASEQIDLLLGLLAANENWLRENQNWPGPAGRTGKTVNIGTLTKNLFNRLHARIAYERAAIAWAQREPAPWILRELIQPGRDDDPDFVDARLLESQLHRATGDYQAAESLLRPFTDSPDPIFRNNGRLLFELASIYTDWYASEPTCPEDVFDRGENVLYILLDLNTRHVEGWVLRARLRRVAGVRHGDRALLQGAMLCAANALKIWPGHVGATQEQSLIQAEIDKLK